MIQHPSLIVYNKVALTIQITVAVTSPSINVAN